MALMASAFQEDRSHFEPETPRASAHGAGGAASAPAADTAAARDGDTTSVDDHVQEKAAVAAPLTKRQKFGRHCGRFKWWYLGAFIIFLIIFLPIL